MTEIEAKNYFFHPNVYGVSQFYVDVAQNHAQLMQRLQWAQQYQLKLTPTVQEGFSALHVAAQFASLETLKKLVATNNFNLNARDFKERTPLHIAALAGRLDILLFLLAAGAEENLTDLMGFTPLRLPTGSLENCYIKFTATDIRELCHEFDAQRKSKAGLPYPFKTRQIPRKSLVADNLDEIIAKYNLVEQHLLQPIPLSANGYPKVAHFIWIGSVLQNPQHRENILTFKQNFPELTLLLWVSKWDTEFLAWCATHQIVALNIDLLFDEQFTNVDFFFLEEQKGNPGFATDHLRLEILRRFGGWYFDVDMRCVKPLTTQDFSSAEVYIYCYIDKEELYFNNCAIAAKPNSKFIKNLLIRMADNYFTSKFVPKINVPSGFQMRFRLMLSGPPTLQPLLALHVFGIKDIGWFDATSLSTSSDVTWMNPNYGLQDVDTSSVAAKFALKKVINSLTHDLMLDPSRLYLDLYEETFKKYSSYHLARLALHFLCTFWQPMEKVMQVIVFDTALHEINYKNDFGNNDIIACSKKFLKFYRSDYIEFWEKDQKYYAMPTAADKIKYFYAEWAYQSLKVKVFATTDTIFADDMALKLAMILFSDARVIAVPAAAAVLQVAIETRNATKLKAAVLEALELVKAEYANNITIPTSSVE